MTKKIRSTDHLGVATDNTGLKIKKLTKERDHLQSKYNEAMTLLAQRIDSSRT